MELRDVMLVFHIAAAGAWLGANLMQAVVPTMAAREGAQAAAGWYRVAAGLGTRLYLPASAVLVATGIVMVLGDDAYTFGSLFVTIGFGMVVVGALLGFFVFDPGSRAVADAIDAGDPSSIRKATSRVAAFGTVDTILLLLTITAMVLRLG